MIKITRTRNKTQGNKYKLQCSNCSCETQHDTLLSVDETAEYGEGEIYVDEEFQIVQCLGCETIGFRKFYICSEDMGPEGELIGQVELYPPRLQGSKRLSDLHCLPPRVLNIYEETFKALSAKSPVLTAIGIRTLIEAICAEENIAGNTLEEKINQLVSAGLLTSSATDILHRLRLIGNQAAHEMKRQPLQKLRLAFEIIENLLTNIYILPEKADRL